MKAILILAALVLGATAAEADGGVTVQDAWARATAGQSTIGAAYLTLANGSGVSDRLVSASTPVANAVEVHATIQDGDIMRMQKIDTMEIAPGATVDFKPNGIHIMLVGLSQPLKQGTTFPMALRFASGATLTVEVAVMGPGASGLGASGPGPSPRR